VLAHVNEGVGGRAELPAQQVQPHEQPALGRGSEPLRAEQVEEPVLSDRVDGVLHRGAIDDVAQHDAVAVAPDVPEAQRCLEVPGVHVVIAASASGVAMAAHGDGGRWRCHPVGVAHAVGNVVGQPRRSLHHVVQRERVLTPEILGFGAGRRVVLLCPDAVLGAVATGRVAPVRLPRPPRQRQETIPTHLVKPPVRPPEHE